jgi:hypothetical protein
MADEREGGKGAPGDAQVRLASERTLLAWARTGLGLMGFGFVVARFGLFLRELEAARPIPASPSTGLSLPIGVALVVLGVAAAPAPQGPARVAAWPARVTCAPWCPASWRCRRTCCPTATRAAACSTASDLPPPCPGRGR